MSANANNGLFEKILVSQKIISEQELKDAKELAQEQNMSLVKALTELDVLTEDDATALLADAYSVRALKLEDVEIDRESVRHIPAAVAFKHKLIPVRRSGNKLVIAMADPSDRDALAAIAAVTDFEIVVFVSRLEGIEHAQHLHYGEPPEGFIAENDDSIANAMDSTIVPDEKYAHIGRSLPLNRALTFDSFVEDAGSQYPLNLARSVVSGQPEDRSCPLVFQGPDRCGKTHLLHAIANYLTAKEPLNKYILTNGITFADDLFNCMRMLKLNLFRHFYRDVKYLLIDDCDAILRKTWAQTELVETIEEIRKQGGWAVLCSLHDLTAHPQLAPRLRQLLESGQIAVFESYTPEGRARILERQIGRITIPTEAISKLTSDFSGEMKDLQEILQQLAAISVLESRELTNEVIEEMLTIHGIATQSGKNDRLTSNQTATEFELEK